MILHLYYRPFGWYLENYLLYCNAELSIICIEKVILNQN